MRVTVCDPQTLRRPDGWPYHYGYHKHTDLLELEKMTSM